MAMIKILKLYIISAILFLMCGGTFCSEEVGDENRDIAILKDVVATVEEVVGLKNAQVSATSYMTYKRYLGKSWSKVGYETIKVKIKWEGGQVSRSYTEETQETLRSDIKFVRVNFIDLSPLITKFLKATKCSQSDLALLTIKGRWELGRIAFDMITDEAMLSNQAMLAKVAMESHSKETCLKAVERITDQAILADVVIESDFPYTSRLGIDKLTDNAMLLKVAIEGNELYKGWNVLERLTDQVSLAKIALDSNFPEVRLRAVERLTDQVSLAKVAMEEKVISIGMVATGLLTDQALLSKIVKDATQSQIREMCVWKINDPRQIAMIATNDADASVRQAALNRQKVKTVAVDLGDGVTMEFVLISPGSFTMGSETGRNDEKPAHVVRITKPFLMGKYEVTQEQWEKIMGSNPSKRKSPKHPVTSISWNDCQEFLQKLNAKIGGSKFSLPTEAQWEYACRAGSVGEYYWGNDSDRLNEYAWNYHGSQINIPHNVGLKKPNAWGLYDMIGSAEEFCADLYDENYYKTSPSDDPEGPTSGVRRTVRGGAHSTVYDFNYRCAKRESFYQDFSSVETGGFRCARACN